MATEKAQRTRDAILEAACYIVQNEGVDAVSMEHVAEVAHLSKGAVTYHFKSKRALNKALLENYAEHLKEGLESHEERYIGRPEDTLIPAYADWFRDFDRPGNAWAQLGVHLLSQQVKDPELVEPVRAWYAAVKARACALPESQRAPTLCAILALEGLFFVHKFGLDTMTQEEKATALRYITEQLAPSSATKKEA